jgi:flagellar basal-body rod protein FlgF
MLKGIYTAAAGMLATELATDTQATNLANVNTVGYKGSKANFQTFAEMLINRIDTQGQKGIGSITTGSKVFSTYVSHRPGAIHETGNTFDVAISGDGFFTVKSKTNGNTYYTRAGNFTVDAQGMLTTMSGDYVQGKLGNIQLNLDEGPFAITPKGEITGKGRMIDQFQISRFTDNQSLEKVSENLYQTTAASQKKPEPAADQPAGFKVIQGALEESNVSPVAELINNIEGIRLYEALQKNIHMHNDALGKAVNEVGRYR